MPGMKPNFLIVGAAKSGTTSLYEYLRQHPEVFMPENKEPTFFAPAEAQSVKSAAEYYGLFGPAQGKKALGEASTAYLYAPESPRLIRDALGPDVKIIILLRNPVDMAYSNWGHQQRIGGEDLSFAEALKAEERRMSDRAWRAPVGWKYNYAYKDRAVYLPQIARYREMFTPDNIKIYLFSEFFKPGLPQFADLCRFLGIDDKFVPDLSVHNKAGGVRSRALSGMLNKKMLWKDMVKKVIPTSVLKKIKNSAENMNRVDAELPPLDPELQKELQRFFYDDVRGIERQLGRSVADVWF